MGCHTWFYRKLDIQPTYNDAKNFFIKRSKESINFYTRCIENPGKFENDFIESYRNTDIYTIEKMKHYINVIKRQLRLVENGYCKEAVLSKYDIYEYLKGHGFYTDDGCPHDIFRKYGYPDDKLFSFEDTLKYINDPENDCHFIFSKEETIKRLKDFWDKNPDAFIEFG